MLTKTINLALFFFFCSIPGIIEARYRPKPPQRICKRPITKYVSDFSEVLSASHFHAIIALLESCDKKTGVEISVIAVDRMDVFSRIVRDRKKFEEQQLTREERVQQLFKEWKIGEVFVDDGILILVVPDDCYVCIQLGTGYPPECDQIVQDIINTIMVPQFRAKNYSLGIYRGVCAVVAELADKIPLWQRYARRLLGWMLLSLIAVVAWYILSWFPRRTRHNGTKD